MTFTDDDLRKIKKLDHVASTTIGSDDLRSLIHRLEAAEKICAYVANLNVAIGDPSKEFEWCDKAIARWMKAAGK